MSKSMSSKDLSDDNRVPLKKSSHTKLIIFYNRDKRLVKVFV